MCVPILQNITIGEIQVSMDNMREHQKEKKRAKHGNEIMRESTKNWKKEKAQTRQRNYEGNQPKTTTKEDLERKKFLFMACLANLPTIPLASLNVCNET